MLNIKNQFQKSNGITMVELLVVIGIIGILSGIMYMVLDPVKTRGRAQDAVRISNIEKIVSGVEAYRAAEGRYPASESVVTTYIRNWPIDPDGNTYEYETNAAQNEFWVYVLTSRPGTYLKFCSNPPGTANPSVEYCRIITDCASCN